MENNGQLEALNRAQVLTLSGSDALAFTRAQLASKVDVLEDKHWQWTAWLDAAGKVRSLGMLWLAGETVHILLRGGDAGRMMAAMRVYVMRAKVQLQAESQLQLVPAGALSDRHIARDGEQITFGLGSYSLCLQPSQNTDTRSDWEPTIRQAISSGHPWLPDEALDLLLPPALGLYGLGATALGKGCYPGQEMVNRLHTRGGHKFGMAHVETRCNWIPGETLLQDGRNVGIVLQRSGDDVLLVVRHDVLDTLPDTDVRRIFPA